MSDFELFFAIHVVDDQTIEDIYDRYDALVSGTDVMTLLTITAEGATALQAARLVVADLERHTTTRFLQCLEDDEPDGQNRPTAEEVEAINEWLEAHIDLRGDLDEGLAARQHQD